MKELREYRRHMLERYAAVVDDLAMLLEQIPPARRSSFLDQDGWSLQQVLAHLYDTEKEIFYSRLEQMLGAESPSRREENGSDKRHMNFDGSVSLALRQVLSDYARLRARELERLKGIPDEDWSRTSRHPVWGVRTLQWWVENSLAHAEEHLRRLQTGAPEPDV